jgi:hypothetical protein
LKIDKATVSRSAICTSNEDTIVIRGTGLHRDLMSHIHFDGFFTYCSQASALIPVSFDGERHLKSHRRLCWVSTMMTLHSRKVPCAWRIQQQSLLDRP